ncbi:MAG TPA: ABC transporter substrate-binding protein [Acidimicrobiales bacterium]|nr:ABC transporter substrate-binding protein [Acidimicrobiales bacterium]
MPLARRLIPLAAVLSLFVAACGGGQDESASPTAGAAELDPGDWQAVLAAAEGQTVDWYMFGGSDNINEYVTGYVADAAAELGVTVNQVKVGDTVEAVNKVIGEVQAGRTNDGSVDLIWINGENFATGKQADLWYCGYVEDLPNAKFVDFSDPAVTTDFGVPVEGCEAPWARAVSVLVYDSARVPADAVASVDSLGAYLQANPGSFAYPAPPDFTGSMAVRTFFYDQAGGVEELVGEFDQMLYDEVAPDLWQRLNELEPSLWRGGETYPQTQSDVSELYANGEISMFLTYASSSVASEVAKGSYPETTRSAVFEDGMIGNISFTAIPDNAGDKAGALVVSNLLLSPEAQLAKVGEGTPGLDPAIDLTKVPDDVATAFAQVEVPPSQLPPDVLSEAAIPEVAADYLVKLEPDWKNNVLQR